MSYQKDKSNATLGAEVRQHLLSKGIETPINLDMIGVSDEAKMDIIEHHMAEILKTLGCDLTDDSLIETPRRVAKMYVKEIFAGLSVENFPKCTTVDNKFSHGEEFVLECNITLFFFMNVFQKNRKRINS